MTFSNEIGEIRATALVPDKSHVSWAPLAQGIKDTLEIRGLPQPALMYTDDPPHDKKPLSQIFPSLTHNLKPPSTKWSHLPKLTLTPYSRPPILLTSTEAVSTILNGFLDNIALNDVASVDPHVVVGFDIEWNCKFEYSGNGIIVGNTVGDPAIVQITVDSSTYIIQVSIFFTFQQVSSLLHNC